MTKRRAGILAALIAAIAAMMFISSGCGGGGTTKASGGLDSLDTAAIMTKVKAATSAATSVHVQGGGTSDGQTVGINMDFTKTTGAGTFEAGGIKFDVTVVGDKVFIKGDDTFYKKVLGANYSSTISNLLSGKYLTGSTDDARLGGLAGVGKMDSFLTQTLSPDGTLSKVAGKDIDGIPTVGIKSTSAAGKDTGTLYVANDGTNLPLRIESATTGSIDLSKWGKVSAAAEPPADQVIDVSKLGV